MIPYPLSELPRSHPLRRPAVLRLYRKLRSIGMRAVDAFDLANYA